MPIVQLKDCQIEGDLAQATLDFQQQIGDVTASLISQIQAIPVDLTLVPQGQTLLDNEAQLAPVPSTAASVATAIGIPQNNPTPLDDEQRLAALGLILIDGILYLADNSGNIDAYRRLFFAVGANITQFLSIVQGTAPMAVTQTYLRVEQLPVVANLTLQTVRTIFNNPAIEKIYTAGDGFQYVVVPTFLGLNQSASQLASLNGISEDQILTQVFWLQAVSQAPQILSQLNTLGITGDQLAASLFGERLLDLVSTAGDASQTAATLATGTALAQLTMLTTRYASLSASDIASLQQEVVQSISTAQASWYENQQQVRFWSTVLVRPQEISDFLTRNSQADLTYLFTQRPEVSGINFQATPTQVAAQLRQSLNIASGTTTVSSLLVNRAPVQLDSAIDQSNQSLIKSQCALLQMTAPVFNVTNAQTAMSCLNQSLVVDTTVAPTVPQVGYASFDSPSSLLFRNMDFSASFNTDGILAELSALAAPLGIVLQGIIQAIVTLMQNTQNAINAVFKAFNAQINPLIAQLEGFLSRFSSFHATPTLDSSILKCALGLDINIAVPAITELAGFVDTLRRKLLNVLAGITKAIFNTLKTLLCMPINLLNSFITRVSNALPSICQVQKVTLPANVEALLVQLRDNFQVQSDNVTAFSTSAVRISANVQALPQKLGQFSASLVCDSPPGSQFFQASASQLNVGVLPNPVGLAAGVL